MSYAIKIKLTETKKSEDSLSHLFGSPIIPMSLEEAVNDLDEEVIFFGQIALGDIAPYDTDNKLPHRGYLYLFLDTASYTYQAKVLHATDEPCIVVDDFNSAVEGFERFTTPYAMTFERVRGDTEGTKLFGDMTWEGETDEELLLQFDPLDNDTGFLSEIDGYAFFTFGDEEHTPENIHFYIDRS